MKNKLIGFVLGILICSVCCYLYCKNKSIEGTSFIEVDNKGINESNSLTSFSNEFLSEMNKIILNVNTKNTKGYQLFHVEPLPTTNPKMPATLAVTGRIIKDKKGENIDSIDFKVIHEKKDGLFDYVVDIDTIYFTPSYEDCYKYIIHFDYTKSVDNMPSPSGNLEPLYYKCKFPNLTYDSSTIFDLAYYEDAEKHEFKRCRPTNKEQEFAPSSIPRICRLRFID